MTESRGFILPGQRYQVRDTFLVSPCRLRARLQVDYQPLEKPGEHDLEHLRDVRSISVVIG